jgi:hypothetical protein
LDEPPHRQLNDLRSPALAIQRDDRFYLLGLGWLIFNANPVPPNVIRETEGLTRILVKKRQIAT